LSSAAVARCGPGDGPRCRGRESSCWSEGEGIEDDDGRHRRQPLSPITVVVVAVVAAAADAVATMPSPLLQPLPMSLRLQRSCRWLVVVSSVAPRLLRRPPSKFISPHHRAIVDAFAARPPSPFAYHRQPLSCRSFTKHQLLLPLPLMVGCCILCPPSSIPTTPSSRKRFKFPPSWTYFDLLRVSTCKWMQNLRGCHLIFVFCDYLINTDSYVHVGVCRQ